MNMATEILRLRRDQSSSVSALLNAMEWESAAKSDLRLLARAHEVQRMADLVLLNVAAHAADASLDLPTTPKTRRPALSFFPKRRHPDTTQLHQRRLFA
jgi:hypothetical protein